MLEPSNEEQHFDARVRFDVYQQWVGKAAAPSREDVARDFGVAPSKVHASFERLAEGKALVLQRDSRELLMAEPFSAVPTPFVVEIRGKTFWGNCIWDALGIPVALSQDARVVTSCGDCGEAMTIEVKDGRLGEREGVAHFLLPVREWWHDVTFT